MSISKSCKPYSRHTLYTKIQPPAKPANGQFGCDRCSSTFDTLAELEAHCHSHTLNLKSFKCKFCERRFNLLHRLKEHEEWTLSGEILSADQGISRLGICGRFQSPEKKLHEEPVNKRPLVCEYCNKTFKCNSTLITHIRLHTGERPFSCNVCGKSYVSNSALSKHRKMHENENIMHGNNSTHISTEYN